MSRRGIEEVVETVLGPAQLPRLLIPVVIDATPIANDDAREPVAKQQFQGVEITTRMNTEQHDGDVCADGFVLGFQRVGDFKFDVGEDIQGDTSAAIGTRGSNAAARRRDSGSVGGSKARVRVVTFVTGRRLLALEIERSHNTTQRSVGRVAAHRREIVRRFCRGTAIAGTRPNGKPNATVWPHRVSFPKTKIDVGLQKRNVMDYLR